MLHKIIEEKNRILAAITLIAIGVFGRIYLRFLLPDAPSLYITLNGITQPMLMMDMFFIVAVIALLSGLLLGGYYTIIVPLSAMIITDIYYGNNYILLFTWSGFVMVALIGYLIKSKKGISLRSAPTIIGGGIGSIILYDLWTNFGCWLGWYPHSLSGLTLCYTLAIPFHIWHLLSTTAILTAIIIPIALLKEHKQIKTEHTIKPLEKHITIAASAVLMILAIATFFI